MMLCYCIAIFGQTNEQLFQSKNSLSADYRTIAKKYQALSINQTQLTSIVSTKPASLSLSIPFEGKELSLQLEKTTITSDNFSIVEVLPGGEKRTSIYNSGSFYHGKVAGDNNSFVTISIFEDQVMGIISDKFGNMVLGAVEKNGRATNEYVLYRESDLQVANPMNCFTDELPIDQANSTNDVNSQQSPNAVGEPVDIYFECDFKFYQDKGSNTNNVINYVLGFFNNTALLYANEDIKIQVSQILVWTTQDPEAAANLNTTSAVLNAFSSRMVSTTYIGDYAHFLSTRNLGGGIAWLLNNPCSASKFNRTAVSAVSNSYNNFPTYSWTVEVVTHELGHNLGSNHTQWCGWAGGPIDNCVPPEGTCANGPTPINGGTIMSYCHLTGIGINFANGFGLLPGNKIRSVVTNSPCFGMCRMTIDVTKQDASCGQANGSASVTATNGTGNLTYSWSNGHTGPTLTGVLPGTYNVTVKDEAGCQVMQVVNIINNGSVLSFSLSPSGTSSYCTGSPLILTATPNPAYTYVWRKDGSIIAGANTASYTVNGSGTYSVTVTSGVCSGSQSVVVSELPAPSANIAANGPTTFCDGGSVSLNAFAGSGYNYKWFRNSVEIPGAIGSTLIATQSGNYTVAVSAGASCSVLSTAVAITVNTSPTATISAVGATSFCAGNNVQLNSSTGIGYTYQWFRNGNPISGATSSSYTATETGNYSVTTQVGTCSKTSQVTNVIVWANPVVSVTPAISTIEKFQTQVLTGNGAIRYNWNGQPAVTTINTTNATFQPLTSTDYVIAGTDNNGCTGSANARINVIGCGDVTNISATAYSPSRVIVRWKNPVGVTSDTLQYRIVGSAAWNKVFVTGEEYELNGLEPGAQYEYNLIALCSTTTVFLPGEINNFSTPELTGGIYVRLYPNPVSGPAKLEIISSEAFSLQLNIFDNLGKRIWTNGQIQNHSRGQLITALNADLLSDGIYYVTAVINGQKHTVKMVVAN